MSSEEEEEAKFGSGVDDQRCQNGSPAHRSRKKKRKWIIAYLVVALLIVLPNILHTCCHASRHRSSRPLLSLWASKPATNKRTRTGTVAHVAPANIETQGLMDGGATAAAAGGCYKKVVMVEETVPGNEVTRCTHFEAESCFRVPETTFKLRKVKKCRDSVKKSCEISYHKTVKEVPVEVCREPLSRRCGKKRRMPKQTEGTLCTEEAETICETRPTDEEQDCRTVVEERCGEGRGGGRGGRACSEVSVRKCSTSPPVVKCRVEMREVCGPESCPVAKLPRICRTKKEPVTVSVPEESCTLVPRKECRAQMKMMPATRKKRQCVKIPKEICVKERSAPAKIRRPQVRTVCGAKAATAAGEADADGQGEEMTTMEDSGDGGDDTSTDDTADGGAGVDSGANEDSGVIAPTATSEGEQPDSGDDDGQDDANGNNAAAQDSDGGDGGQVGIVSQSVGVGGGLFTDLLGGLGIGAGGVRRGGLAQNGNTRFST